MRLLRVRTARPHWPRCRRPTAPCSRSSAPSLWTTIWRRRCCSTASRSTLRPTLQVRLKIYGSVFVWFCACMEQFLQAACLDICQWSGLRRQMFYLCLPLQLDFFTFLNAILTLFSLSSHVHSLQVSALVALSCWPTRALPVTGLPPRHTSTSPRWRPPVPRACKNNLFLISLGGRVLFVVVLWYCGIKVGAWQNRCFMWGIRIDFYRGTLLCSYANFALFCL